MIEKNYLEDLFKKYNSQLEVGKVLGYSQMTISRLKRKFGIEHDGKKEANKRKEKISSQKNKMIEKYKTGLLKPYWLGKKMPLEMIEKANEKKIGKPAWNSGTAKKKITICLICDKEFNHSPKRKRKFCSKVCSSKYFKEVYSDGRLKGNKNPNYGNGDKTKEAYKRGCFDKRILPSYTRGKKDKTQ